MRLLIKLESYRWEDGQRIGKPTTHYVNPNYVTAIENVSGCRGLVWVKGASGYGTFSIYAEDIAALLAVEARGAS